MGPRIERRDTWDLGLNEGTREISGRTEGHIKLNIFCLINMFIHSYCKTVYSMISLSGSVFLCRCISN